MENSNQLENRREEQDSPLEIVDKLFQEGKLLARVMDTPTMHKGESGFELDNTPWEEELGFMEREEGMPHASTTLILPEKRIPLYKKAYGFLFDANKVTVEHVAKEDSGSRTGANGELFANKTNIQTLEELKDYYRNALGTQQMNEVNIVANKNALVELVIQSGVRDPSTLLGLEISKRTMSEKGMEMPIYQYDERIGAITKFELPKIDELLLKLRPATRPFYEARLKEVS